ncbi:putative N-acylneuraminate cytidylyltransferase [Clostridiales bacterium oral taxon 876 str. F0540]|nr:putative N-acylneuraminate cytidylyltransferase [Clostridiales bacterium oral taxon 876 str. F0540]
MTDSKKILAIIPARGGSKGLPRKNIKLLDGKPLISYTIEAAKQSRFIDRVIVSTDDLEIAQISKSCGAEVPFLRPDKLSGDNSSTVEALKHAVMWLRENEGYECDLICVLQCTSPLRGSKDIDGTIQKLFETNKDAAVSVCEVEVNPYWTNIFAGDKLEYFIPEGKNILRRQDLPKIYRLNGAVYLIKTDVFLKEETLEPENITGYIMGNSDSVDIDDEIDFCLAEAILHKREIIKCEI